MLKGADVAARALEVRLQFVETRGPDDFDRAFSEMTRARAWILWGVEKNYIADPEILRPMESFSTKRECDIYQSALAKVQLERFDKLDRENRQRAIEGGAVVRGLREKRGWTQGELAEQAGITQEIVSNVESGWPYPLAAVVDLSRALGVKLSELAKYDPHFPRNIITQTKCWPDTVGPRGPKGE